MDRDRLSKIILSTALFILILQIIAMIFHYPNIALCYIYEDGHSLSISKLPLIFGVFIGIIITMNNTTIKKATITIITLLIYFIITSGII